MKISSDEITSVIKKQIESYKVDLNVDEVGTVLEVGDGIAIFTDWKTACPESCLNSPMEFTECSESGRKQCGCRAARKV